MKDYDWNEEKNQWLKTNRDISFEEIVYFIENGGLLDNVEHPNKQKLYWFSVKWNFQVLL